MPLLLGNAPVVLKDFVDPRGPSFFDTGRSRRRSPSGTDYSSIFVIVLRWTPKRFAASRRLRPFSITARLTLA
jgi:hypothetical protein